MFRVLVFACRWWLHGLPAECRDGAAAAASVAIALAEEVERVKEA